MIAAVKLDKARVRNLLRKHQAKIAGDAGISPGVKHQCRRVHERQQPSDVDIANHALYARGIFRRGRKPLHFIERPRLLKRGIRPLPGRKHLPKGGIVLPPALGDQREQRCACGDLVSCSALVPTNSVSAGKNKV